MRGAPATPSAPPARSRPGPTYGRRQGIVPPTRWAGQHEGEIGVAIGQLVEGSHEAGEVLARFGGAHGEDETRRTGGEERFHEGPRCARRDGGKGWHSRRDHPNAVRMGAKGLHHLAGDEGRVRVHPRASPQRPPYELGIGQRGLVAELRVVQWREVVHGGHHPGPLGRRHDEIRPVHHVDACPTNHSTGGREPRLHIACNGRAGIGRRTGTTVAGRRASIPRRLRQLTAKARTSRSARVPRAWRAPLQKAPIPVGTPSRGVASRATRSGAPVASPTLMGWSCAAPMEPCTPPPEPRGSG